MKYHLVTFGCQMNHSDSERIATVLELAGLSPASDINGADLLIINSCSVRQSAINRIHGLLNNLRKKRKLRSCHPETNPPAGGVVEGSRPLNNNADIPRDSCATAETLGGTRSGLCPQNDRFKQLKTILTGCVLDADKKKLADKFNLIIDIKELTQKPKILIDFLRLQNQEFKAFDYTDYFKINPQYRSKFSAYVPIMTGCNNFCAYCAVPYTRGREISRPAEEIIAEIKALIKKGYKEITLLGQNVNSYASQMTNVKCQMSNQYQISNVKKITKKDEILNTRYQIQGNTDSLINSKIKKINFPQLLKQINAIPGDFWIRFLTSHPKDMSNELIKTMTECDKVCEYVHLPIQSGDDEILSKMNRHYTQERYLILINKIRKVYRKDSPSLKNCPLPAISTDVIVGFPGETKKQFANTAKVMRKVKFDLAYLSEYSPRAGTAAAKLEDTVSIAEKKHRKEYLNEVLRKTALANNKKYIGKTIDVLIEKINNDFIFGKTRTFKNVKIAISADTSKPQSSVIARSQQTTKQSRVKRDKVRDCRAFRLPDEKLAMTNIKIGQFAKIKITQAGAWGLEGQIV